MTSKLTTLLNDMKQFAAQAERLSVSLREAKDLPVSDLAITHRLGLSLYELAGAVRSGKPVTSW
jgi:hypothetical protein